jgi:hypothetical protein
VGGYLLVLPSFSAIVAMTLSEYSGVSHERLRNNLRKTAGLSRLEYGLHGTWPEIHGQERYWRIR